MQYLSFPVTSLQQNCSLVWCDQTKKAALIDPGGDENLLIQAIKKQKVELKSILLTHGHLDHVGASQLIAGQFNVPIIGPQKADSFWLDNLPLQSEMFNQPHIKAFTPDQWLEDGDEVSIGNLLFKVLHCPGHTPGHVVFFQAEKKIMFVGDVLFKGSIGRTDFPQGDHAMLINEIKNKLFPLGDDVTIVPGHGPISTLGHERQFNVHLK